MYTYLYRALPNSPNSEGLLNRRPTDTLRQDGAYIDREQVVPYQEKRHQAKCCETQDCRPENETGRNREPAAQAQQQSDAVVVGRSPFRIAVLLPRFHGDAGVGVRRQRGLAFWSQHHYHRVGCVKNYASWSCWAEIRLGPEIYHDTTTTKHEITKSLRTGDLLHLGFSRGVFPGDRECDGFDLDISTVRAVRRPLFCVCGRSTI